MRMWQRFTPVLAIAFLSFCASAGTVKDTKKTDQHPYRTAYKKNVFGPAAAGRVAVGAAVSPRKGSFAHKLAIGAAAHVAGGTTKYAVAAAHHEDLHYHRSDKKGFGPRLNHALVSTVVTHKTSTGRKTVAAGNISGAAVTGLVASSAATGGIALGADAGVNVAHEFWPKKKRKAVASKTARSKRPG